MVEIPSDLDWNLLEQDVVKHIRLLAALSRRSDIPPEIHADFITLAVNSFAAFCIAVKIMEEKLGEKLEVSNNKEGEE